MYWIRMIKKTINLIFREKPALWVCHHSIMHLSGSNKAISAFLKANILDFFSSALFIIAISVIKLSFWWRNFTFSVLMSKFSSIFRDTSSFNLKKSVVVVVVDSSLFSCLILTLFVGHSGLKIEKKMYVLYLYFVNNPFFERIKHDF